MLVRNIIECAKMGDFKSTNILSDRYLYIADKFYDEYSDKISREKVYSLYNMIIENYLKINYPLSMSLYIYNEFRSIFKNLFAEEKVLISDYVALARTGDKNAREFLINHYSYIVTNKAKEYDYLEYEELVQYGMVKLIETIDIQLKNNDRLLFTEALIRAINIYFSSTLKNKVGEKEEFLDNNYTCYDELDNKKFMLEFEGILDTKLVTRKEKMYAIKYYIEGLNVAQISRLYNCSDKAIYEKIKIINEKVKSYYGK